MKQSRAMLLLLFLGGVFVQRAEAAPLSPAQALETRQQFGGADTNGDGLVNFLEYMAWWNKQKQGPGSDGLKSFDR